MQLIDIHTHVYPTPVAQKATESIQDFYDLEGSGMNGTVSMLLERVTSFSDVHSWNA